MLEPLGLPNLIHPFKLIVYREFWFIFQIPMYNIRSSGKIEFRLIDLRSFNPITIIKII